jgi:CBS domain containing-hemolysin-like protein
VDEYGGTAGLVTVEDIAEELLGSISEQPGADEVIPLGEAAWSVDGALPIEDVGELLDEDVDETDANTIAGLILALLGRLPGVGDEVVWEGHRLRVTMVRGRRITRVEVSRRS